MPRHATSYGVQTEYRPLLATLLPLFRYRPEIVAPIVAPEIKAAWKGILRSRHWHLVRTCLHSPEMAALQCHDLDVASDCISAALSASAAQELLARVSQALVPWRIGPYKLGDLLIDSEWRSFEKWHRIAPLLPASSGLRIADVGCSNGYFLFKLASLKPEVALGFDPIDRCWLQFALLQSIFRLPNIGFSPTGLASLAAFPGFFDLIICMGVMYHQRDPKAAIAQLYSAARPGGQVIVESLVIDRPGTEMLIPTGRYAKMRNAWVIPTADALAEFMEVAGFRNVHTLRCGPVTPSEQRRTAWAPYESLSDFLDPSDPSKTVEGYPAPHSAVVVGFKES